ncbi:MAG: hypothetical protein ACR2OE_16860 [Thermomicrobiales bacterium]
MAWLNQYWRLTIRYERRAASIRPSSPSAVLSFAGITSDGFEKCS